MVGFDKGNTPNVSFHTAEIGEYQIVSLKGELVYGITDEVKEKITKVPTMRSGYMIDLLSLNRIDSTGLGVIVNLAKRLLEKDTKLVFVVNNPLINDLFVISQFHKIFPIVKSLDEAKKLIENDTSLKTPFSDYLNMSNSMRKE